MVYFRQNQVATCAAAWTKTSGVLPRARLGHLLGAYMRVAGEHPSLCHDSQHNSPKAGTPKMGMSRPEAAADVDGYES